VRSPILMAKVYQNILEHLAVRGFAPPRRRVRIGRIGLTWILLRYGLI
jgi:hypothetical protein